VWFVQIVCLEVLSNSNKGKWNDDQLCEMQEENRDEYQRDFHDQHQNSNLNFPYFKRSIYSYNLVHYNQDLQQQTRVAVSQHWRIQLIAPV
jgi:hypothetical protein